MTTARRAARWTAAFLLLAAGSGCVAIPVGKQEFATEFATDVRAAPVPPSKEYAPSVSVVSDGNGRVGIAVEAKITSIQPQVRHYSSVSVTKRKMLAVGLWARGAPAFFQPKDGMKPVSWGLVYAGNGTYSDYKGTQEGRAYVWGDAVRTLTLGVLPLPFVFFAGLFGPYEHDWHYTGKQLHTSAPYGGREVVTHAFDSRDLDLLEKFSPSERRRIGAWTWRDNAEHPHNTFWNGFALPSFWPLPGCWKYCTYVVHEPVEVERTTAEAPIRSESTHVLRGPYRVFLQIPEVGFARTLAVPRGEERALFNLQSAATGRRGAKGSVRILPPSGGAEEAWNDDVRAVLELMAGRDYPVTLDLPLPRLSGGDGGAGAP